MNNVLEIEVSHIRHQYDINDLVRMYQERTHDEMFERIGRLAVSSPFYEPHRYAGIGYDIVVQNQYAIVLV